MPHSRRPLSIHVTSPTQPLRPQWLGDAPDMTRAEALRQLLRPTAPPQPRTVAQWLHGVFEGRR